MHPPELPTRRVELAAPAIEPLAPADVPLLTPDALAALSAGTATQLYHTLGAHPLTRDGVSGTAFAVWAPNAASVSVIGEWNRWDRAVHPMHRRDDSVWERFLPGLDEGDRLQIPDPYPHRAGVRSG